MYNYTCCVNYNQFIIHNTLHTQRVSNYYTLYSKRPIFRVQSGIKLHQAENIYTDTVCGVCDKYEVWVHLPSTYPIPNIAGRSFPDHTGISCTSIEHMALCTYYPVHTGIVHFTLSTFYLTHTLLFGTFYLHGTQILY